MTSSPPFPDSGTFELEDFRVRPDATLFTRGTLSDEIMPSEILADLDELFAHYFPLPGETFIATDGVDGGYTFHRSLAVPPNSFTFNDPVATNRIVSVFSATKIHKYMTLNQGAPGHYSGFTSFIIGGNAPTFHPHFVSGTVPGAHPPPLCSSWGRDYSAFLAGGSTNILVWRARFNLPKGPFCYVGLDTGSPPTCNHLSSMPNDWNLILLEPPSPPSDYSIVRIREMDPLCSCDSNPAP